MATATAKKPSRTRTRKVKRESTEQAHFEGLEPPRIKAIDKLAISYRDARDERMDALKVEIDFKAKLLVAMNENKLTTYRVPGEGIEVAVVSGEPTITVRKAKDETLTVGE